MSTQNYNNRQAPTTFTLSEASEEVEVLATTALLPTYREGMSVNGGGVLHVEVDASTASGDISLRGYRRLTNDAAWSLFYTASVAGGSVVTDRIGDLYGFADVRLTAEGDGSEQDILVSGIIYAL